MIPDQRFACMEFFSDKAKPWHILDDLQPDSGICVGRIPGHGGLDARSGKRNLAELGADYRLVYHLL
jgi:hypothetical protein